MKLKKNHKKIYDPKQIISIFLLKASVFKNSYKKKCTKQHNADLIRVKKIAGYPAPPDIRYPAFRIAGYPAKSVSGASLINSPKSFHDPKFHFFNGETAKT